MGWLGYIEGWLPKRKSMAAALIENLVHPNQMVFGLPVTYIVHQNWILQVMQIHEEKSNQ